MNYSVYINIAFRGQELHYIISSDEGIECTFDTFDEAEQWCEENHPDDWHDNT